MIGGVAQDGLPADHLDLLERPVVGVLTTMGRDGWPQASLVWADHDGACAMVSTTLERQKGRNLIRDPRVSLLVVDPGDTTRFVEIRGEAELISAKAEAHLDELTRRYTQHPSFYGHIYPVGQRDSETRVICRIHPNRVVVDAIHKP